MTSVLILAVLLAQQAAPPEKATLSGTVVDSLTGAPLGKVQVVAIHPSGKEPGASTVTDGKGNFRLVEIEGGQYYLGAGRNGYLNENYGARKTFQPGSIITLSAGENLANLQIRLTPFSVIAGTVRDSDGEAIANAEVKILTSRFSNGKRSIQFNGDTSTNDLGEYRFADLQPGRYYIVAKSSSSDGRKFVDHSAQSEVPLAFPLTTFYPGVTDPNGASAIDLEAGGRFTNANITLLRGPVYHVKAHVDAPAGMWVHAMLTHSIEAFDTVNELNADEKGDFTMLNIPSGSYVLNIDARQNKPYDGKIDLFTNEGSCNRISVPLVVDHANLEGLRATVKACGELTGRITSVDDKGQTAPVKIRYVAVDFDGDDRLIVVREDGTFTTAISEGRHNVNVPDAAMAGRWVKGIRSGNQDTLRGGFSVSGAEHVDVTIVLGTDGGTVSGNVMAGEKPAAGVFVALIPNDPALRARKDFTWDDVSDNAGHFEMKGVAPGEYKAFAWDDIERGGWLDPEVVKNVESKGEPVSVKAKETSPALTLHVIP